MDKLEDNINRKWILAYENVNGLEFQLISITEACKILLPKISFLLFQIKSNPYQQNNVNTRFWVNNLLYIPQLTHCLDLDLNHQRFHTSKNKWKFNYKDKDKREKKIQPAIFEGCTNRAWIAKMALFNPCVKLDIFWTKWLHLKWWKIVLSELYS